MYVYTRDLKKCKKIQIFFSRAFFYALKLQKYVTLLTLNIYIRLLQRGTKKSVGKCDCAKLNCRLCKLQSFGNEINCAIKIDQAYLCTLYSNRT